MVRQEGLYPGSPSIVRALLRPQDRLICCELHPEEASALRRLFAPGRAGGGAPARDGWAAIGALLPPAHKRGLVLIDPPYEQGGEHDRLAARWAAWRRGFRPASLAGWYPIKHLAPVRTLHERCGSRGCGTWSRPNSGCASRQTRRG